MSQITIKVGPRSYPFVCGNGEEEHIRSLAAIIDEKYQQLGSARSPQEAQNMLFAALFLADELAEARETANSAVPDADRSAELEAEVERLTKAEAEARAELEQARIALAESEEEKREQNDLFGGPEAEEAMADRLEAIAARAEEIANALEAPSPAS